MLQRTYHRFFIVSALACTLLTYSTASLGNVTPQQAAKIEKYELQQTRIQRELDFTKVKLAEARKKIEESRDELIQRQRQISRIEQELGSTPSETTLELLANDKQRVAVTELAIKSQQSAVERLERKKDELQQEIKSAKQDVSALKKAVADANNTVKRQAQQEAAAHKKELARLMQENRELKFTLIEEQRRRAIAETRIAELVRTSDERLTQIRTLEAEITAFTNPPGAPLKTAEKKSKDKALDLSMMVLDGEQPIYQGDEDGEHIVIRSHSIDDKVVMTQIGKHLYQAELSIAPGKAYFDLRRRRYRGVFPENFEGEYRFIYDISNEDNPTLKVETVSDASQVVSNTEGF